MKELRLLGMGKGYEIGVAIELTGEPFVPIHDHRGNCAALLDLEGNIVENYRYTAFGLAEGSKEENINPWQYASKRLDQETGLIFFGKRDYNPKLMRWMTPDPAGFIDGMNLYAFVHNNPLKYLDPDGRYAFVLPLFWATWGAVEAAAVVITTDQLIIGALSAALLFGGAYTVQKIDNNLNQKALEEEERQEEKQSAKEKEKQGTGGRLKPHSEAEGEHSSFKRDPKTGKITKYETYRPQSNPRNPNPWEVVKRYDGDFYPHEHYNKETQQKVRTPHVHDPYTPGEIRLPEKWEMI